MVYSLEIGQKVVNSLANGGKIADASQNLWCYYENAFSLAIEGKTA
ncbi:MAG: hypothetical protein QRY74_04380 [Chlamydia sp.]